MRNDAQTTPIGWGFQGPIENAVVKPRRTRTPSVATTRGRAMQIAYWLGGQEDVPSVAEIIERWSVSLATAYRWRAFALSGGTSFQSQHSKGEA